MHRENAQAFLTQYTQLILHNSNNAGNLRARATKSLQVSGSGSLGISIVIVRTIHDDLAENSNGRLRLRTRRILRRGIIPSLWPYFVCFCAVPLASPFLFQILISLSNTDREQTCPNTIDQLKQQCQTNMCGQLVPFMC